MGNIISVILRYQISTLIGKDLSKWRVASSPLRDRRREIKGYLFVSQIGVPKTLVTVLGQRKKLLKLFFALYNFA